MRIMVFDIKTLINLKGYRVRINVNNEEYEGIITNVTTESLRVALGKVHSLTDGGYYHILFFFAYEINSCTIIDRPEDLKKVSKKPNKSTEEDGPRLVKLRPLPFHQRGGTLQDSADSDNLLIGGVEDNEKEYIQDDLSDGDEDDDDILPLDKFVYPIPDENIIIDMVNDDFKQAISNIMKEQSIGISLKGGNIGRHGNVCWILVSTEKHVYLFDLCALGKKAFDNGLKDALQNPSILKIFHDCREPSDALFHQFGVRLVNIFDTQSSDALVQCKLHNRMPRFVRSLGNCVSDYLKIDVKIPDFTKAYQYQQWQPGKDLSVWTHRPLPKRLVKGAVKDVMFLKELRLAILGRYIADLNCAAEIYLSVVRDASEQELDLSQSSSHMLPDAFQRLQTRDKKYFHNHSSHQANSDNTRCYKFLMHGRNSYNTPNRDMWFKKNEDQMKESIVKKASDQVPQRSIYEQCDDTRLSGMPNLDTNNETAKISGFSSCVTSSKETCSETKHESQSCSASAKSEKQHYDILSRCENQPFQRSSPKKRIDWPKASQRTSSATNITLIPAGMLPLGRGTKIKQSS